jgi:hypothetical protein
MNPTESNRYPDLLVYFEDSRANEFLNTLSPLGIGDLVEFQGRMQSLGDEYSVHEIELISLTKTGQRIEWSDIPLVGWSGDQEEGRPQIGNEQEGSKKNEKQGQKKKQKKQAEEESAFQKPKNETQNEGKPSGDTQQGEPQIEQGIQKENTEQINGTLSNEPVQKNQNPTQENLSPENPGSPKVDQIKEDGTGKKGDKGRKNKGGSQKKEEKAGDGAKETESYNEQRQSGEPLPDQLNV